MTCLQPVRLHPGPTARLRLRDFGPGDVDALVQMHREPRLREWLVDDQPLDDPRCAALLIEHLAGLRNSRPGLGIWHAERLQHTDSALLAEAEAAVAAGELQADALAWLPAAQWRFCGWFNLMPMDGVQGVDSAEAIELGCRLLPDAWGGGLALEGGQALLRHAFLTLGLDAVHGVSHPRQRSVHAVLGALGFSACGLRRQSDAQVALHRIGAAAWRASLSVPLRQRQRAAVRQQRLEVGQSGISSGHNRTGIDPGLPGRCAGFELGA